MLLTLQQLSSYSLELMATCREHISRPLSRYALLLCFPATQPIPRAMGLFLNPGTKLYTDHVLHSSSPRPLPIKTTQPPPSRGDRSDGNYRSHDSHANQVWYEQLCEIGGNRPWPTAETLRRAGTKELGHALYGDYDERVQGVTDYL